MNTIVDKAAGSLAPWEVGAAMFSTNHGEYGRRIAAQTDRPPLIMRSDPDEDMARMVSRLRRQFPSECRAIQCPTDRPIDVYCYFDHYDVYIQGYFYLHEVLSSIAFQNLSRLHQVLEFVDSFKSSQVERFNDIGPETQDLFTEEERTIYDQNFLEDALIRLKAWKMAAGNIVKQNQPAPSTAIPTSEPSSATLEVPHTSDGRLGELKRQSSAPDHALGSSVDNTSTASIPDMTVKLRRQSSAPSPPRPLEVLVDRYVDVSVDIAKEAEHSAIPTKLDQTAHPRRRSSVSAPFSPRHKPLPQRVASAQSILSANVQPEQRRREHYTDPEPQYANPADEHLTGYQLLGLTTRLNSNEAGYPTVKAIPLQPMHADSSLTRIPQYGELAVIMNDGQQNYYDRIGNGQLQGRAGNRQSDHGRSDPRRPRQLSYQGPPDSLPVDLHYSAYQRQAVGYRSSITTPGMHPVNAIVWGKPNDMNNFHHPGAYSPLPYYAPQPEPAFHSRRRISQPNTPRRRQTLHNPQALPSNNRGPPGPGAHTLGQPGPTGPLFVTRTRPPMGFSNDARVLAQQDGQHRGRQLSDAIPYRTVSDSPRYDPSRAAGFHLPRQRQVQDPQSRAGALTSNTNSRRGSDRLYQYPYEGLDVTHRTVVSEQADQAAARASGLQVIGRDAMLRQTSSGGWSTDTNPYPRQEGNEAGIPSYIPFDANEFDHRSNMQSGVLAIDLLHNQMQLSFETHNFGTPNHSRNTGALRREPGSAFVKNTSLPFDQPPPSTLMDTQHEGPEKKLWVSGDRIDIKKETLLELFAQCGKVEKLLCRPAKTHYHLYAFVYFEIAEDAARAIEYFNERPLTALNGRRLKVRYAERAERSQFNRPSIDNGPSEYRRHQPTNMRDYDEHQDQTPGEPSTATISLAGAHNSNENLSYHEFRGSKRHMKKRPSSSQQISPEKFAPHSVSGTKVQEHPEPSSTLQPNIRSPLPQVSAHFTIRRNSKSPKGHNQHDSTQRISVKDVKDASPENDYPALQQENKIPVQVASTTLENTGTPSPNRSASKPPEGQIDPYDSAPVQDRKAKKETAVETLKGTAPKGWYGQHSNHWSNSSSKPIALEDYIRPKHMQKRKKERLDLSISGSISMPSEDPHGKSANKDQGKISAPNPKLDDGTSLSLREHDLDAGHGQVDEMGLQLSQFIDENPSTAAEHGVSLQEDDQVTSSLTEEKYPFATSQQEHALRSGTQNQTSPVLQTEASSPRVTEMEGEHSDSANNNTSNVGGRLHGVRDYEIHSWSSDKLSEHVKMPQIPGSSLQKEGIVTKPPSEMVIVLDETALSGQLGDCSVLSKEDDTIIVSSHETIIDQEKSDSSGEPGDSSTLADTVDIVRKFPGAALMTPEKGQAIAVVNTPGLAGQGKTILELEPTPTKRRASKLLENSLVSSPNIFGNEQALGTPGSDTIPNSQTLPSPRTIEIISTPIETRKKKQLGTKSKRLSVPKKSMTHISNIFNYHHNHAQEGQEPGDEDKLDLEGNTKPEVVGKESGLSFEPAVHKNPELPTSNVVEHNEANLTTISDAMESEEVRNVVRSCCPSPESLMIALQGFDADEKTLGEDTKNSVETSFANDSEAATPSLSKEKSNKKKNKKKKKAKTQEASTSGAAELPSAIFEGPPDKYMPEPEMPWVVEEPKPKEPKVRTPLLDFQESTSPPDPQTRRRILRAITEKMSELNAEQQFLGESLASKPHIVSFLEETRRERMDRLNQLTSGISGLSSTLVPELPDLMKQKIEGMAGTGAKDFAKPSVKLDPGEPSKGQKSSVSQASVALLKAIEDYYTGKARYSEILHNVRQAPFTNWINDGDPSSSIGTMKDDSPERYPSQTCDDPSRPDIAQNTEADLIATHMSAAETIAEIMVSGHAAVDLNCPLEPQNAHASSSAGDDTMDKVTRLLQEVKDAGKAGAAAKLVESTSTDRIGSVNDSGQPTTDNTRRTSLADFSTHLTVDTTRRTSIMDISDDSSNSGRAIKTPSSSADSALKDNDRTTTDVCTPTRAPKVPVNQPAEGTEEAKTTEQNTENIPSPNTSKNSKEEHISDLQSTQPPKHGESIVPTDHGIGPDSISTLQHLNNDDISTSLDIRSAEGKNADSAIASEVEHIPHTPIGDDPKDRSTATSPLTQSPKNDAVVVTIEESIENIPPLPVPQSLQDKSTSMLSAHYSGHEEERIIQSNNGMVKQEHENSLLSSSASKETTVIPPLNQSREVQEATMQTDGDISNDLLPPLPPSPEDDSAPTTPPPRSPKGKARAVQTDLDLDTNLPSPMQEPSTTNRKSSTTSANNGMDSLNSSFIPSGVEDLSPKSSPPKSHFTYSNIATSQSGASEASEGEERPFMEKRPIFEEFLGNLLNGGDPWSVPNGEKKWGRGKK